jgi:hypothetical protein
LWRRTVLTICSAAVLSEMYLLSFPSGPTYEGIYWKVTELSLCSLLIFSTSFKTIWELVKQFLTAEGAGEVCEENELPGSWFVKMF